MRRGILIKIPGNCAVFLFPGISNSVSDKFAGFRLIRIAYGRFGGNVMGWLERARTGLVTSFVENILWFGH